MQGFAALSSDYPRSFLETLTPAVSSALIISNARILHYRQTLSVGKMPSARSLLQAVTMRKWNKWKREIFSPSCFFLRLHWQWTNIPSVQWLISGQVHHIFFTAAAPENNVAAPAEHVSVQPGLDQDPQDPLIWARTCQPEDQQNVVLINTI